MTPAGYSPSRAQQGSVVLVALCFIAILGIALASYLSVSRQAMKFGDLAYVKSTSEQLAENGLEQALWAFNHKNWDSALWTPMPSNATSVTRTITYLDNKYGRRGLKTSINIRVDHYAAAVWNNLTEYKKDQHDCVWYQGVWYQCIRDNDNSSPTGDTAGAFWSSAPAPWNATANYRSGNIVLYAGTSYTCQLSHINQMPNPSDTTYWLAGTTVPAWSETDAYTADQVVLLEGTAYRCLLAHSNQRPPNSAYWVGAPTIYVEGSAVLPDATQHAVKTQLRAPIAPAPLFPNAIAATSTLRFNSSNADGIVDSYNFPLAPVEFPLTNDPAKGYSAMIAGGNISGTAIQMAGGAIQGYVAAPSTQTAPYAPNVALTGRVKSNATDSSINPARIKRGQSIPQFDAYTWWDPTRGYDVNNIVNDGTKLYLCIRRTTPNIPPTNTTYWVASEPVTFPPPPSFPDTGTSPRIYTLNSNLNLNSGSISIDSPITLVINGDLRITGTGQINIGTGGSAQIFFSGRLQIAGSGGINNQTHNPQKLLLIGTSTGNPGSHSFTTRKPFHGCIYMPYTTRTLLFSNSAGDPVPKVYGAVSARSITFNSAADFHYDTSLRTAAFAGLDAPFTVGAWHELVDPAERVIFP